MANQLSMDKSIAINNVRTAGSSERRIAKTLGVSCEAARRHLRVAGPNDTAAPADRGNQASTGSPAAKSTTAPTGSGGPAPVPKAVAERTTFGSRCEPFRELIIGKETRK